MVWYLLRGFKWGKREEKEGEKRKRKEEEKGRKKGEIIDLTVVPLFSPHIMLKISVQLNIGISTIIHLRIKKHAIIPSPRVDHNHGRCGYHSAGGDDQPTRDEDAGAYVRPQRPGLDISQCILKLQNNSTYKKYYLN